MFLLVGRMRQPLSGACRRGRAPRASVTSGQPVPANPTLPAQHLIVRWLAELPLTTFMKPLGCPALTWMRVHSHASGQRLRSLLR